MKREADIQAQIISKLERAGWLVNKILSCTNPGWTDLECFRQHPEMVFIEVKKPGEKPRPLQDYRHKKLRDLGWTVIVADKLSDIKHLT
jgi:hypothetical protein